ncbi:ribosomal protein L2 [Violaceomyces palustris]|uniref:Ribosomal protein L2 n=1 Tax=Violaceomyces palustris TaxID=1673888 RepID=A0ACD0NPE4_9BASI|nr:ribosomal protein L2 [Violaceomyces palustris]
MVVPIFQRSALRLASRLPQQYQARPQLPLALLQRRQLHQDAIPSTSQVASGFSSSSLPLVNPTSQLDLLPRRRERRLAKKQRRKESLKKAAASTVSARLGVSTETLSPYVRKDRQFKTFKPITRSIRWLRTPLNEHLWKGRPERSLTVAKRGKGGRNHHGHVTVRGRGGGHKRRIRLVDFYRWESGEQDVLRIEYDPGRSAHIALVEHKETKRRSYILAPDGLREGDTVQSYRSGLPSRAPSASSTEQVQESQPSTTTPEVDAIAQDVESSSSISTSTSLDLGIFRTQAIRPGNFLPLNLIPIGTTIHSITLLPNGPAKLVRSAGTFGQLVSFSSRNGAGDSHAQVRLQSGEVRLVPSNCCAAIGTVSNKDHQHARLGKAGRSRWLGRRPKVRGVAMNACDHPHGGGRGKSKSNMHPRSIWGHLTKGARTRKPHTKTGNKMVVRERPRRNGKRLGKP